MVRGGAREGAGRKGFCEKTVRVCWRVSERAKDWLTEQAAEENKPIGAVIDDLLGEYLEEGK